MEESVQISREEAVVIVTLNRPDVMNAIDATMRDTLIDTLGALNEDDAIGAVVLTGAGDRAFSAGQDLAEAAAFELHEVEAWMNHQSALLAAVRNLDKPVVAAFNGLAVGVGFQMGLLADLRVAHADIHLGQPEVRVGLSSILGSYLMSLHLGYAQNVELSLMGKLISGTRAREVGLINELTSAEAVLPRAVALAKEFASLPRTAVRLTKRRFRDVTQAGFDGACRATVDFHLEDYKGGAPQLIMRRFLEERTSRSKRSEGRS